MNQTDSPDASHRVQGQVQKFTLDLTEFGTDARVTAELTTPQAENAGLVVLGHGAGAGYRHPLMVTNAQVLHAAGWETLTYHFPYMEAGSRRPDRPKKLHAAVRAAVQKANEIRPGATLLGAGRSMGGRMTSQAQSLEPLPGLRGLIFFAFPLHPAKKPGTERAEHLKEISVPMLFLSGTRDKLAQLDLLSPVVDDLKTATLHVVEGADHSFQVLKRSGRSQPEVEAELTEAVNTWSSGFL